MTGIVAYCMVISLFYCLTINFGKFFDDTTERPDNLYLNFICFILVSILIVILCSPIFSIVTVLEILGKLHGVYMVMWIGMISLGIIMAYITCPLYAKIAGSDFFTNKNNNFDHDKHEILGLMCYLFLLINTIFFPFIILVNYILIGMWKLLKAITINNKFYTVYKNSMKEDN